MNDIIRVVMEVDGKEEFILNARGGDNYDTLKDAYTTVDAVKRTLPNVNCFVVISQ